MGSSDSCGHLGTIGGCQDEAETNAADIRRLSDFQDVLTQFVSETSTDTD